MISHYFQVWRHTCFSISRSTGKFKLIENGVKVWEQYHPEIIEWMKYVSYNVRSRDINIFGELGKYNCHEKYQFRPRSSLTAVSTEMLVTRWWCRCSAVWRTPRSSAGNSVTERWSTSRAVGEAGKLIWQAIIQIGLIKILYQWKHSELEERKVEPDHSLQ